MDKKLIILVAAIVFVFLVFVFWPKKKSFMETTKTIYDNYHNYIKNVCESGNISQFKSNEYYKEIVETLNKQQGEDYLKNILEKTPINIEKIKEISEKNDKIGNGEMYNHLNMIMCSPVTLRYIYHSYLILNHIKNLNLKKINFIEIGGGYGGLCLCLHLLSKEYDIHIESYTIIDLTEILKLQEIYLKENGINNVDFVESSTFGKDINHKEDTFLISAYAFSEIPKKLQESYIDNLFSKINHGFFVWNFIDVYDFGFKPHIDEEVPNTGAGNKYVYF